MTAGTPSHPNLGFSESREPRVPSVSGNQDFRETMGLGSRSHRNSGFTEFRVTPGIRSPGCWGSCSHQELLIPGVTQNSVFSESSGSPYSRVNLNFVFT